jgi:hypothetical protein
MGHIITVVSNVEHVKTKATLQTCKMDNLSFICTNVNVLVQHMPNEWITNILTHNEFRFGGKVLYPN